ncbi:MAG: hypothetical protein ABI867_35400 [Kofleriaceae bacterium]
MPLRYLALLPLVGACDSTLDPDPPHELPYETRTFAVSQSSTLVVTAFDQTAANNIAYEGPEIPTPRDSNDTPILSLPAASDVAIGRRHACIISPTGSVHCWGDHSGGALGEQRACLPPEAEGGVPNCILDAGIMPSLPPVREIAAGDDVTCAITMDDRVACWGDGSRTGGSRVPALDPPTPISLPGGELLAADRMIIARGIVCAIDFGQRLWCWGDGFGARPELQPQTGVLDVSIGTRHSCIIDDAGFRCHGDNRNGQSGDFAEAKHCSKDKPCQLEETTIDLDATRVAVGERHTCALLRDGSVVCFGSNEVGQLGRNDAFLVGDVGFALDGVTDLASGFAHVCAQRVDRSVWCWGSNLENI